MSGEPDWIVFRAWPGAPPGWMPPGWEGRWEDRSRFEVRDDTLPRLPGTTAIARPTGLFEGREDGAVAEVWEIRPAVQCRHCGTQLIERYGVWVDRSRASVCLSGGIGGPAATAYVLHEPMPKGMDGSPP